MHGYYENHHDGKGHPLAWYTRNDHCTPHFHNSIELVYLLEGELLATLDGEELRVLPGTLLVSSSYMVHGYETPGTSLAIIAVIPVSELPSVRQSLAKQAFAASLCADDAERTLRSLMEMMVAHSGNALAMRGLCYTILGLLMERIGLVEARAGSRAAFIRDVLDYLQVHHTEPLSVARVAMHFGYSRSRFSHIFTQQLGYTLADYIGVLRCKHAAQLLRETDMPVSDVAMAVGFESLRTFYRTFKKQYDMTPNRYART